MPENVRALIVVLVLAVPAFYVGRQLAASVLAPREFAVWRNVWLAVTAAAFLSGSFLVFAVIEIMICLYARAVRAASPALFILLLPAVPLVDVPIGGFGSFNLLFDINNARLLAIVLLLPILFAGSGRQNGGIYSIPDRLIVGYVVLLTVLNSENVTQFARAATVYSLDMLIPYFAFSRLVTTAADLRRVMMAFIISVVPLSLIGVFETGKGWLLYSSFMYDWRGDLMMRYLFREGTLRASASAAGPIVLGFIIVVAIGCLLAVQQSIGSRKYSGIAFAMLGAGLVATLSRGPWVGATVLILVYLATSPTAAVSFVRFAVIGAVVLIPLLSTSLGDRVVDFLPFLGSVDAGSVTYRQLLFDNAILVIERNPWFGSNDYLLAPELQKMETGEHIIDVVNTYLAIALKSGLVGLGFFLTFSATILIGLWRVLKFKIVRKTGLAAYTRGSMAIFVAMMVTIGTVSFLDYVAYVYWCFAGLCVAVIRIAYRERATVARAAQAVQVPA